MTVKEGFLRKALKTSFFGCFGFCLFVCGFDFFLSLEVTRNLLTTQIAALSVPPSLAGRMQILYTPL